MLEAIMDSGTKAKVIPSFLARHPLVAFFLLSYAISWLIWLSMVALALDIRSPAGRALNIVAIAGPTLAGLALAGHGWARLADENELVSPANLPLT
jgi:hypothetical protein